MSLLKIKRSVALWIVLFVFGALLMFPGLGAADTVYTLEFSQLGMDGAVTQTDNYHIVDFLSSMGIDGNVQDSKTYSVLPLTGSSGAVSSSGALWMFY